MASPENRNIKNACYFIIYLYGCHFYFFTKSNTTRFLFIVYRPKRTDMRKGRDPFVAAKMSVSIEFGYFERTRAHTHTHRRDNNNAARKSYFWFVMLFASASEHVLNKVSVEIIKLRILNFTRVYVRTIYQNAVIVIITRITSTWCARCKPDPIILYFPRYSSRYLITVR